MKGTLLLICISFLLFSCSSNQSDTPEKAVSEIISCYNNDDINCLWNRIDPKDKYTVSKNMINNINNNDLFILMGYALNKDNLTIDNITAEEYLFASFKIILGDRDMELSDIDKIDETTYSANIKVGEKTAVMPLKLIDNKWYMKLKEN